jgi:DNA-3-methyladenine glycosylase II
MAETARVPSALDTAAIERALRHLKRRDAVLGRAIRLIGPCEMLRSTDPYRFLVRSILFQQISVHAGRSIEARLKAHFGGRLPPPERLRATRATTLRSLGLSRQKALAVHSIAEFAADGELRAARFRAMDDEQVIADVTRIHGVGEWTAHMLLLFALRRPDVLPVGDFGIRKGLQRLDGLAELPSPAALTARAEAWRPWRSVASWYLWRCLDPLPPNDE